MKLLFVVFRVFYCDTVNIGEYSGTNVHFAFGDLSFYNSNAQSVIFIFKEPLKYGHRINTASMLWSIGVLINGRPVSFFSLQLI